jgi:hypothetical protein
MILPLIRICSRYLLQVLARVVGHAWEVLVKPSRDYRQHRLFSNKRRRGRVDVDKATGEVIQRSHVLK